MRAAHRLSLGGVSWGLLVVALISGCTGDPGGVDVGSDQVNLTNRRGGDNSPAWRPR